MKIHITKKTTCDCFVSVVCVLQNQEATIKNFLYQLSKELNCAFADYEIVLIDQCSTDGTPRVVESLLASIPSIRLIELANQVHIDVARAAGLENAIGDCVILLTPQQDPVEVIQPMVKQCLDGSDVVVGTAPAPQSIFYRLIRPAAQEVLRRIGYSFPRNATSLLCLSRRAINAVTQTGRFHHSLPIRVARTGYSNNEFPYILLDTARKKNVLHEFRYAVHMIVFNSTKPLRWMSVLGITGSVLAFLFGIYSVLIHAIRDNVVEGWTTIVVFVSVQFMFMFVMMAFLGEYLGRLLDERSGQQQYSVVFEKNSSVMLEEDRCNVLSESEEYHPNLVQTGRNR